MNWIFQIYTFSEFIRTLLKLWTINLLFNWFFLNISPEGLTLALFKLRIPYHWAWSISGAFRFIKLFQRETKDLIDAQLMRGIPLDGNYITKLRLLPTLIVPLIYIASERSQQLTETLFVRGWIPTGYKTHLYYLNYKTRLNFAFTFVFGFINIIILLIEFEFI